MKYLFRLLGSVYCLQSQEFCTDYKLMYSLYEMVDASNLYGNFKYFDVN